MADGTIGYTGTAGTIYHVKTQMGTTKNVSIFNLYKGHHKLNLNGVEKLTCKYKYDWTVRARARPSLYCITKAQHSEKLTLVHQEHDSKIFKLKQLRACNVLLWMYIYCQSQWRQSINYSTPLALQFMAVHDALLYYLFLSWHSFFII